MYSCLYFLSWATISALPCCPAHLAVAYVLMCF